MSGDHEPLGEPARATTATKHGRAVRLVRALLCLAWALIATGAHAGPRPEGSGLRFGEHDSRTRVVLDFDRAVRFSARTERTPNRLVLDLGEVDWQFDDQAGRPRRGLARGFAVDTGADGRSQLVVDLAKPARIVSSVLLPPSKDSVYHRLVVDMVADRGDAAAAPTKEVAAKPAPTVPVSRPTTLAALPSAVVPRNGHSFATARPRRPAVPVVVLDPGHGGIDPGATSVDGQHEKDLVLDMARELRALIQRSGRYRVELTRDKDEFVALRDRIARARQLGGEVFISLHADSLRLSEQRGASIYTLSEEASDEEAARFAAAENKADILTGADLSQHDAVVATILIDLAMRDTNNKSIALADLMAEELGQVTQMVKRHRRFAGFAVLKSPDMPSVLLELGYLSNPDDARNLAQPDYRAKLGKAIVRALDRYFKAPRS